jgi:hypothetical protein
MCWKRTFTPALSMSAVVPKPDELARLFLDRKWRATADEDGHSQPSVESSLQQNTDEPFTSRSLTLTERVSTLGVDHWRYLR